MHIRLCLCWMKDYCLVVRLWWERTHATSLCSLFLHRSAGSRFVNKTARKLISQSTRQPVESSADSRAVALSGIGIPQHCNGLNLNTNTAPERCYTDGTQLCNSLYIWVCVNMRNMTLLARNAPWQTLCWHCACVCSVIDTASRSCSRIT